jgi:hypothetical protein
LAKACFSTPSKELFEGNQKLFTGLGCRNPLGLAKKYPVIRISFGDGVLQNRAELDQRMQKC